MSINQRARTTHRVGGWLHLQALLQQTSAKVRSSTLVWEINRSPLAGPSRPARSLRLDGIHLVHSFIDSELASFSLQIYLSAEPRGDVLFQAVEEAVVESRSRCVTGLGPSWGQSPCSRAAGERRIEAQVSSSQALSAHKCQTRRAFRWPKGLLIPLSEAGADGKSLSPTHFDFPACARSLLLRNP